MESILPSPNARFFFRPGLSFCFIVLFLALPFTGFSRHRPRFYEWAAGVRLGIPSSLSVKHYVSRNISIEGILTYNDFTAKASWTQVAIAGQYNFPLDDGKKFNFYLGTGVASYQWHWKRGYTGDGFPRAVFGTFTQAGFDYKFKKVPINVSVDWMPFVQFGGYDSGLAIVGGAVGLRYILK